MIEENQCPCCGEIHDGKDTTPLYTPDGPRRAHRECMLREVLGGIGHHLDHEHFCVERDDPDAGLDYRTSAILVDALVSHRGVDAVSRMSR